MSDRSDTPSAERDAAPAAPPVRTAEPPPMAAGSAPAVRHGATVPAGAPTSGGAVAAGHAAGHMPQPARRRRPVRRLVLTVLAIAAIAGGGYEGWRWWTVGRFEVATDDAYIAADTTILAAKVGGYVTDVAVADNQVVKAGDVVVRIDDGDYRLAVQADQNRIATEQSTIARIGEQVKAAEAAIDQAKATVAAAEADLTRATQVLDRQQHLVKTAVASQQALDNAVADRDHAVATLAGAKAALAAAEANVKVLEAQQAEAESTLGELRTALAQAERDLSFTVVRAPVDGVVGNRAVHVGNLVQAGTRLVAIVPLDGVYVDANFKETQVGRLKAGQHVEVEVDAFPDRPFEGVVDSVSPASGSVFSLLPPENATGNFTKIVQRVPVRIRFTAEELAEGALRPGMSVLATVDTRTGPHGLVGTAAAADASAAANAAR